MKRTAVPASLVVTTLSLSLSFCDCGTSLRPCILIDAGAIHTHPDGPSLTTTTTATAAALAAGKWPC